MNEDLPKPFVEPVQAPPGKADARLPKAPWKPIAAYVAVALVAGAAGYFLNRAPAPAEEQAEALQAEEGAPAPETFPSAPSTQTEPEVLAGRAALKINWAPPQDWSHMKFFDQYGSDGTWKRTKGYWHLGEVADGEYAGHALFTVPVECEGPCFHTPTYRLLWNGKDTKPIVLAPYSESTEYGITGDFIILKEAHIPEFEFPRTLRTPQGVELAFDSWKTFEFDPVGKRSFFRDPAFGDVFVDDPDARLSGTPWNGFYVVARDGTMVLYKLPIPFMPEGGTVPDVVWASDGSKNTYDYNHTDVNGCGSSNVASVLPASAVDRAKDLTPVGRAGNGDVVYGFRDPAHPVLQKIYDDYAAIPAGGVAQSKEEFLAGKAVFVWIDPFGRMIKFFRSSYMPAVECGKPVIYLYPEKTTDVSVKIAPQGGLRVSEPSYDGGWKVRATPEGALTDLRDGSSWPYLFWEGRGGLYETPSQGWVVKREDVPSFVRSTLAAYGLNAEEIADFSEFWLPRMTAKPWYFVTFLGTQAMDRLAPLSIEPRPDSVFRILMDYRPLDAPIEVQAPPKPVPARRDGFTVVEWGGVLGRE